MRLFLVFTLLAQPLLASQDHVVQPNDLKARLGARASERQSDLATVDRVLRSEKANLVAARMGTDLSRVREALPSLTDIELRDLASRADKLQTDPAAGLTHDVEELLIIFLIVAIVILVIKAA